MSLDNSMKEILAKIGIEQLNPMQKEAHKSIESTDNVLLLSPTGSGKTLAFLLPLLKSMDQDLAEVQSLIIVPTRELAIQIEQVARSLGSGFKINELYGGRSFSKDLLKIKHKPAILIGTPGRIADHLRRESFSTSNIKTLILDEFDKSLEIGFAEEMSEIISYLPKLKKKILTSATKGINIPFFVHFKNYDLVDYTEDGVKDLAIKAIVSPEKDKLATLVKAIHHLGNQPGIVFCNYKDSIHRISEYLLENGINHGCFYGGLEQNERERALIKFRNGTHQLLLATDLAARGIDIPEIKYIIHYHLPFKENEFVHRNGRTARMFEDGTAYVLHWKDEKLPDYIENIPTEILNDKVANLTSKWETLFISGGRQDKISKGDIVGAITQIPNVSSDDIGTIELKQDCAFVAINIEKIDAVIDTINNVKLKKKKVRVYAI
jgi:superfamily II DNA/RNA helicase